MSCGTPCSTSQVCGRWGWLALAGSCYGLAMLLPPKTLVLVLPAMAFLAWRARRPDAPSSAKPWAPWAALAGFVLLAFAPTGAWAARNVALHGETLLGPTGGINLWLGNHEGATGGYMQPERPRALDDRLQRYPPTLRSRDARAYADLALEYMVTHPSQEGLLALTKLERFWWTISADRLGEFAEGRMIAFLGGTVDRPALQLAAKLLQYGGVVMAGAGLIWGGRRGAAPSAERTAGRALLYSSLTLFWLVHVPFFAEPRYRIPVVPFVQVLEGAGVVATLDWLRATRPGVEWRPQGIALFPRRRESGRWSREGLK